MENCDANVDGDCINDFHIINDTLNDARDSAAEGKGGGRGGGGGGGKKTVIYFFVFVKIR